MAVGVLAVGCSGWLAWRAWRRRQAYASLDEQAAQQVPELLSLPGLGHRIGAAIRRCFHRGSGAAPAAPAAPAEDTEDTEGQPLQPAVSQGPILRSRRCSLLSEIRPFNPR